MVALLNCVTYVDERYTGKQSSVYTRMQWCTGGYTQVYAVYQPPGVFLTAYTHLSDHK